MRFWEVITEAKSPKTEDELWELCKGFDRLQDFYRAVLGKSPVEPRPGFEIRDDAGNAVVVGSLPVPPRYAGRDIVYTEPTKAQVTRYATYQKKLAALEALVGRWRDEGRFDRSYGFDINAVRISRRDECDYTAWWKGLIIGYLTIDQFSNRGTNTRHIFKTAVEPDFQRKGVGTLLYDTAEADLAKRGLRLVPSPQRVLSDDAYGFWKKRDPESVKGDSRWLRPQYVGKVVQADGRDWRITNTAGSGFVVRELDGNTTKVLPFQTVFDQLGEPVSQDAK